MKKFIFIVSTGGGILSKLFEHEFVLSNTEMVVSDRECGGIEVAKKFGINNEVLLANNSEQFSKLLMQKFSNVDVEVIFVSFYTKMLMDPFLSSFIGRVFNCHPSILPANKGLGGFRNTLASNALFMGCTLHEVDAGLDTGMSVIQAAIPIDRAIEPSVNHHKVFLAQYYSALQFIRWAVAQKLVRGDYWRVDGASYKGGMFSPNLDGDFFDFFKIKNQL
jgi:phosphoribosylglycinamide formyltransferase-1